MSVRGVLTIFVALVLALLLAVLVLGFPTSTETAHGATQPSIKAHWGHPPAIIDQALVPFNEGMLNGAAANASDPEIASASNHGCGATAKARWAYRQNGPTGRLYTTHYTQGFCRRNGHLTWVGPLNAWGDLGDAGRTAHFFWDKPVWHAYSRYFVWGGNNHADGGHSSITVGYWTQCIEVAGILGCPQHRAVIGKMLVFSDGHSEFYHPSTGDIAGW